MDNLKLQPQNHHLKKHFDYLVGLNFRLHQNHQHHDLLLEYLLVDFHIGC